MKKILFILVCVITTLTACAQRNSYSGNMYAFACRVNNGYGWSDWSEWENSDIKFTYFYSSRRLVIYSKRQQVFTVGNSQNKTDDDNNSYIHLECYDNVNSERCDIDIIQTGASEWQMYVRYGDRELCYCFK